MGSGWEDLDGEWEFKEIGGREIRGKWGEIVLTGNCDNR